MPQNFIEVKQKKKKKISPLSLIKPPPWVFCPFEQYNMYFALIESIFEQIIRFELFNN